MQLWKEESVGDLSRHSFTPAIIVTRSYRPSSSILLKEKGRKGQGRRMKCKTSPSAFHSKTILEEAAVENKGIRRSQKLLLWLGDNCTIFSWLRPKVELEEDSAVVSKMLDLDRQRRKEEGRREEERKKNVCVSFFGEKSALWQTVDEFPDN